MEIQKHTSRNLTKSFSKIQEAENGARIQDVFDDPINKDDLRKVIAYIITLIGFNTEKTSAEEMQVHLAFIRNNFPMFRVAELKLAFEVGVRGDLQDEKGKPLDLTHYQSFNSIYISNVINGYKRYKARQHKDNPVREELKELPVMKLDQKKQAIKAFKEYKEKGSYFDFGNLIYDYLDQENVLQITNDRKKQFWDQAIINMKAELKNKKELYNRHSIDRQIDELIKGSHNAKVKSEAKRLALWDYFDGLIEMEMDINDELR